MSDPVPSRRAARVVLALTGLLVIGAALALPHFAIEPDLAKMLPPDHPYVRLASLLDDRAANRRSLFVFLRGAITDPELATLVGDLESSPLVAEVAASRNELLGPEWARRSSAPLWFLPPDAMRKLARRLGPEGRTAALQETLEVLAEDPIGGREIAARDPLGLRWLLTEMPEGAFPIRLQPQSRFAIFADGRGAVIRLVGRESAMNAPFARELLADVEGRLRRAGREFEVFGGYAIARADSLRIRHDLSQSIIWSSVLVGLYVLFFMRSHAKTVLTLLPVGLAAFVAISLGSLAFGPLTPVAIAAAAVLLGLGIDFAIHYLMRYDSARRTGSHAEAVRETNASIGKPLWIGMATTAIAFLSLAFGEFGGLAGFGMVLALGLLLAFLATRFLLPVFLAALREPGPQPRPSYLAARLDAIAAGPRGRGIAWLGVGMAAVSWIVVALCGVELRTDPETLRPADDPVGATRSKLEAELGMALLPCFLLLDPSISTDAAAATIRDLRDAGLVVATTGLSPDTAERRRWIAEFHTTAGDWLPATLQAMDDLGFAVEEFRAGLETLHARLSAPAPAVSALTVHLDGRDFRPVLCYPKAGTMDRDGFAEFERRIHAAHGDAVRAYGTPALQAELARTLRRDLGKAIGLTVLLAFGLILLASRSLRAGALALLPVVCGSSITLAVIAATGSPITLANFVAIPFLLGIAVDDGVHLVSHLHRHRRTGVVGVAVVRTSLTTIIAFGSLVTAQTPGLASLGWIVALGVSVCMLTSLLVLPPLWSGSRS